MGFSHRDDVDFNDGFFPIVKQSSIFLVFATIAHCNHQTTFLQDESEERIKWSNWEKHISSTLRIPCCAIRLDIAHTLNTWENSIGKRWNKYYEMHKYQLLCCWRCKCRLCWTFKHVKVLENLCLHCWGCKTMINKWVRWVT